MNRRSLFVWAALVVAAMFTFSLAGCTRRQGALTSGGSTAPLPGGGMGDAGTADEPQADKDIVYPAQWQGKVLHTPIHGSTLAEVMLNLDKETAGNKLNFIIYHVGSYSTATFPVGATFKDMMDVAFNRWRVFFYNDPDALVIGTSVDYGHVQSIVNRVSDAFTVLGEGEKAWQGPCGTLVVQNGSPTRLLEYAKRLAPKGKFKVEGNPPELRMDMLLTGIPLERALTYLAWAGGAQPAFSSDGTLYFQFK